MCIYILVWGLGVCYFFMSQVTKRVKIYIQVDKGYVNKQVQLSYMIGVPSSK